MDFLGISRPLEANQSSDLLHPGRVSESAGTRRGQAAAEKLREPATHEQLAVMRRELDGLVAARQHRAGQPHHITHGALRNGCGGPAAAAATAGQLAKRIDILRDWATRNTP